MDLPLESAVWCLWTTSTCLPRKCESCWLSTDAAAARKAISLEDQLQRLTCCLQIWFSATDRAPTSRHGSGRLVRRPCAEHAACLRLGPCHALQCCHTRRYGRDNAWRQLVDVQWVAAMGPPGGGRTFITPRYLRHFNTLALTQVSDT